MDAAGTGDAGETGDAPETPGTPGAPVVGAGATDAEVGVAEATGCAACTARTTPSADPRQTTMQTARAPNDALPGVLGRPRSVHRRAWVSMRRDPSLFFIG